MTSTSLSTVGVALKVDVLMLERAPQPLDEDVVHPAPASVHGNGDAGRDKHSCEGCRGELRALIGFEDLRRAFASPSCRAAMQKETSIVFDSRHDRTARLAQSMIAT